MSALVEPTHALTPSGNLPRRQFISRLVITSAIGAAALAVAVLGILVAYTATKGLGQLSFTFFTAQLPAYNGAGGGLGPALVGTVELSLFATLIALPIGVMTALFASEFARPRVASIIETGLDLMAGLPSIVIGVFVVLLIVDHFQLSVIAGAVALAIVELPLIARATLEALSRVPKPIREAADALGVARWRITLGVVLPTASNSILTATVLAVARAAGETAPVLFTCFAITQSYEFNPLHAVPSMPVEILNLTESSYPAAIAKAWGAAFLLMLTILIVNIAARVWLARSRRKRGV